MEQAGRSGEAWTRDGVETRLIAAFRALPGAPVFSRDGRVSVAGARGAAEALNWAARFVPDNHERLVLLTWARCRAMGSSVRAYFVEKGWDRATAERTRRRAIARIVAGLRQGQTET